MVSQSTLLSLSLVAASYLLGGFSPGYWLVRLRTGSDIRRQGSGGTGATNAGRVLGKGGFAIVFLGDALKGALVAKLSLFVSQDITWQHAACLAVVVGHIWPLQLGFRGGKGISTLLGAWLAIAPQVLLPCLLLALPCLLLSRRFTLSGLAGLLLLPASAYFLLSRSPWVLCFSLLSLIVVLYAHREHFRKSRERSSA